MVLAFFGVVFFGTAFFGTFFFGIRMWATVEITRVGGFPLM
jgi:hypothetical protein